MPDRRRSRPIVSKAILSEPLARLVPPSQQVRFSERQTGSTETVAQIAYSLGTVATRSGVNIRRRMRPVNNHRDQEHAEDPGEEADAHLSVTVQPR
jgi:hypothetical protein